MLKLALGPLQYYWPRDRLIEFYRRVADSSVDIVYLGETTCARRHEMRLADWLDTGAALRQRGKEVIMSTLTLIESDADLTALRKVTDNGDFDVEANDMGAVHYLAAAGRAFVAGPHLNLYNPPTVALMAAQGARRWVAPLELDRVGLSELLRDVPSGLATEVFAYGRMPLAFSARCFTARHRNLGKDNCGFCCIDHPDGLSMQTREGAAFLVLNGVQTQSARVCNLIDQLPTMRAMGVDVVRISPQAQDTERIIALFDQVRRGALAVGAAQSACAPWMPAPFCNGYWHGQPGQDQIVHDAVPA